MIILLHKNRYICLHKYIEKKKGNKILQIKHIVTSIQLLHRILSSFANEAKWKERNLSCKQDCAARSELVWSADKSYWIIKRLAVSCKIYKYLKFFDTTEEFYYGENWKGGGFLRWKISKNVRNKGCLIRNKVLIRFYSSVDQSNATLKDQYYLIN